MQHQQYFVPCNKSRLFFYGRASTLYGVRRSTAVVELSGTSSDQTETGQKILSAILTPRKGALVPRLEVSKL